MIPDYDLAEKYQYNGLFSKIIDRPAEEALKHGMEYNVSDADLREFLDDALDRLDWEEKAVTAIRWARLFGGAIIVMLLDDGGGLEEPVNWADVHSVEELRVYERAIGTAGPRYIPDRQGNLFRRIQHLRRHFPRTSQPVLGF